MVLSHDSANDVLQETYIRVFNGIDNFKEKWLDFFNKTLGLRSTLLKYICRTKQNLHEKSIQIISNTIYYIINFTAIWRY